MKAAKIVATPTGQFWTTTKNTSLSQRETLERTLATLAALVGATIVYKQMDSRGGVFYRVQAQGFSLFQSATNTIFDLSQHLAKVS
jgi:hypothetical protein